MNKSFRWENERNKRSLPPVEHFFSNKTWLSQNPDTETKEILKHWQTEETNIFFHLGLYILMTWWTSALASTIAVPSGVFIPGRLSSATRNNL